MDKEGSPTETDEELSSDNDPLEQFKLYQCVLLYVMIVYTVRVIK